VAVWFAPARGPRRWTSSTPTPSPSGSATAESVDAKWDLNGDGKVDARDVDEIARRSVSIR
jgi:hypothetical protein